MKDAIVSFFLGAVGPKLCVLLCSALPVIELRGSIPIGAGFGLPWWETLLLSLAGNLLPVPLILTCIEAALRAMAGSRVGFLRRSSAWLRDRAERNRTRVERYGFLGLFLFVAVPLPGTGAWTGSLVAALMGMRFRKAFLSVLAGVLAAGIVMTLVSYGVRAAVCAP